MGRYLPVRTKGSAAIALCGRCQTKVYYADLVQDPNNKMWVCEDCRDVFDPWRLPSRMPENITLEHPWPDDPLVTLQDYELGVEETGVVLGTEFGDIIGVE